MTGLVESLVGLVPGGGGVKETLYRWFDRTGEAGKSAWKTFMQVGYGRTASSPVVARELAMFRDGVDEFVMNRDRMLDRAVRAVKELSGAYRVERREPIPMAGREAWVEMQAWLEEAREAGRLTPHDVTTGTQIAMIATGGDVGQGAELSEDDILALERKAFLALAKTPETRARIEHMLNYGSPLRN